MMKMELAILVEKFPILFMIKKVMHFLLTVLFNIYNLISIYHVTME